MDAFMYFITKYCWIFVILSAVLLISVLGIYVDGRREKAEQTGEKIDNQLLEQAQKEAEEKKNNV